MHKVYNNVEDKIVFSGDDMELIDFVRKIVIENEDADYSVIGVSDAIEYIEDNCGNLELEEDAEYDLCPECGANTKVVMVDDSVGNGINEARECTLCDWNNYIQN